MINLPGLQDLGRFRELIKNVKKNKTTLIILLLITLIGAYFRLYHLGLPSFWVDELDFVDAARSMIRVGEPLLDSGYPYPRAPLFTYSLMASFKLFGVSEFASRLPSAIFGILAIPMMFVLGRGMFNERVGLLSALFLTISPFAIGWSRACRMYALFQLLFLAGVYFFYRGFEHGHPPKSPFKGGLTTSPLEGGRSSISPLKGGLRGVFQRWHLNLPHLLLGGFFLLLSYSTHQNAGLFLLTFIAYLLMMGIAITVKDGFTTALKSKYLILLTTVLGGLVLAYVVLPPIREFVTYAAVYQPKWAEVASAQNPWRIFEFLFGWEKVPFNLLFVFGLYLILKRGERAGIFSLLTFAIPIILFSFVFEYRKNDYIFHVYPIFYLVAAYALDASITGFAMLSAAKHPERLQRFFAMLKFPFIPPFQGGKVGGESMLTLFCLLWIPLTFNFRLAQAIPRLPDGTFNGAIYHNEWKEAATFLREKLSLSDALMSTLPLTVKYYLGRAEFNLNWSNGDLARQKQIYAADGRLIDFYSGADIIEDLSELEGMLKNQPSGWLLVDNYRFENDVYVPTEVRRYIQENLMKVYETRRKTVSVFCWLARSFGNELRRD